MTMMMLNTLKKEKKNNNNNNSNKTRGGGYAAASKMATGLIVAVMAVVALASVVMADAAPPRMHADKGGNLFVSTADGVQEVYLDDMPLKATIAHLQETVEELRAIVRNSTAASSETARAPTTAGNSACYLPFPPTQRCAFETKAMALQNELAGRNANVLDRIRGYENGTQQPTKLQFDAGALTTNAFVVTIKNYTAIVHDRTIRVLRPTQPPTFDSPHTLGDYANGDRARHVQHVHTSNGLDYILVLIREQLEIILATEDASAMGLTLTPKTPFQLTREANWFVATEKHILSQSSANTYHLLSTDLTADSIPHPVPGYLNLGGPATTGILLGEGGFVAKGDKLVQVSISDSSMVEELSYGSVQFSTVIKHIYSLDDQRFVVHLTDGRHHVVDLSMNAPMALDESFDFQTPFVGGTYHAISGCLLILPREGQAQVRNLTAPATSHIATFSIDGVHVRFAVTPNGFIGVSDNEVLFL